MVHLKAIVGGKNLTLVSENDFEVTIKGVLDTIDFVTTEHQMNFNPHENEVVTVSFLGKNLTAINYGEKNKDVVGDIVKFKVCKGNWCQEYRLVLGLFLSKEGNEGCENETVPKDKRALWFDYFLGFYPPFGV